MFHEIEFKLYFIDFETKYLSWYTSGKSGTCEIKITAIHNNTNNIGFQSKRKYDFVRTNEILDCVMKTVVDAILDQIVNQAHGIELQCESMRKKEKNYHNHLMETK